MMTLEELRSATSAIEGSDNTVLAAGIFSLTTDFVKLAGYMAAGDIVGGVAGDVGSAVGAVGAGHVQRDRDAKAKGFDNRWIVVSVTAESIHLFDYQVGHGPTRLYFSLPRASTRVEIKKRLLSRHLLLTDSASNRSVALQGSVSALSSVAKGDKEVLAVLQ